MGAVKMMRRAGWLALYAESLAVGSVVWLALWLAVPLTGYPPRGWRLVRATARGHAARAFGSWEAGTRRTR